MENNNVFYTKGETSSVVSRINQVHTITMFCPMYDYGVVSLKNAIELLLPKYKVNDCEWEGVPAIDALNAFIYVSTSEEEFDKDILGIIVSSLKMFRRLKYINFKFTFDEKISEVYKQLIANPKVKMKGYIYNVERLELNLSDMFSQEIIDLFNKVLIYNDIMPGSYFERVFTLDFTFDNYVSFISMFLENNHDAFDKLDGKIIDYFRMFPQLVKEQKPEIRVITNYTGI